MKHVELMIGIAAMVLGLMIPDAGAAGRPNPNAIKVDSPFKGEVVSVSPESLSVKGEVKLANPPKNAKDKPMHRTLHFHIKDAKITSSGKPYELKDVQRGDSARVTFTTKKNEPSMYYATQVDITKGTGASGEKSKDDDKK